ncbi:DNA repair protein RAD5B isoform X2 [Rhodamnia argentea]|uniref:DNA repair protein RAD5B isoform X2 n=1 Tax=Rhodamnia argentea TaxID=178133 RepID=A0ABM3H1Q8_9MYRT|nr:DNA repair protein RAD5B isoform X2 [Rhodamnia argentea]
MIHDMDDAGEMSIERAEKIERIRTCFGHEMSTRDVSSALSQSLDDVDAAIDLILRTWKVPFKVKRALAGAGARISAGVKPEPREELEDPKETACEPSKSEVVSAESEVEAASFEKNIVKTEPDVVGNDRMLSKEKACGGAPEKPQLVRLSEVRGAVDFSMMSFDEPLVATDEEYLRSQSIKTERMGQVKGETDSVRVEKATGREEKGLVSGEKMVPDAKEVGMGSDEGCIRNQDMQGTAIGSGVDRSSQRTIVKAEPDFVTVAESRVPRAEEKEILRGDLQVQPWDGKKDVNPKKRKDMDVDDAIDATPINWAKPKLKLENHMPGLDQLGLKPSSLKSRVVEDRSVSCVVVEDADFALEPCWHLVGRSVINGVSTTKGRKLIDNEIIHFNFPTVNSRNYSQWIVRFSTKRHGEIGRLEMAWAKCILPLVKSSKVKVCGRCIAAPANMYIGQEIMLYVSFYMHNSVFTNDRKSSWRLDDPSNIDSTEYPLLTLFKLLKIKPFREAAYNPEELNTGKCLGNTNPTVPALPLAMTRKAGQKCLEENKDEQAISEAALTKIIGSAGVYDLEELEPPDTLMCTLKPYQKEALYWMSRQENQTYVDAGNATKTLNPCWAEYRLYDEAASSIYVNVCSGEATTQFPDAQEMTRGGILADAMGLGKTVMTIALIHARPSRRHPDANKFFMEGADDIDNTKKRKRDSSIRNTQKVKGGTLIICPMALLGQWKDELETHSKPESMSIFVHYGGDKTNDPRVFSGYDVVLTTYGVLTAAYKHDQDDSIFHRVEWYRVVLDEAHTIKSWMTQGAQAAFALLSHFRWCLTGTPIQNNLQDLYSLIHFLRVEPWCNWAWWKKRIQSPYESGDGRGIKLVRIILNSLMLRRTKESKDKEGRPILTLPPTDIQTIECEQSEAEQDFYDALFRRSKVRFDQFVAQGKVLHNYASILELLLRLRQCCNHPFLVMSRSDSQQYADLNKLARKFLDMNPHTASCNQIVPSRAYVEEVVDGIRRGENTECPICLESADDPVLTPCAHRMCRECLLSSWLTHSSGLCPICRQMLRKTDLITCPTESQFRVDVEKNWKESSKVSKLLDCLEKIRQTGSGEKSIVFSQWTSFMDLLEIPLKRRKFGHLRFDGKLSQKQRERILKEFNETNDKMILLMSLRAGGVGLNLTAASHVFLMDPWWNPAVEEQAIMRIHRIGQKRIVSVRRFIVKDTVEERMQQVQARKQRLIAGALTDEEVRSARLEELKMLFR